MAMDTESKKITEHWNAVMKPIRPGVDKVVCDDVRIGVYEEHATNYDDLLRTIKYTAAKVVAQLLHKYLNGRLDASVLDIGAGTGLPITELKKFGNYSNVDGLDPSENMMKVAQEKGLYKKTFVQYFTIGSGIEPESYDVVVCTGSFAPGHIPHDAIKEMHKIVKPGGYIVIVARASYQKTDPDLQKLRPLMEEMVKTGTVEEVENFRFDNYAEGSDGLASVLKRL